MSSLRRFPSLECADAVPHFSSTKRKIARHSSLPILSLYKPQGLPSFHPPRHGSRRHRIPFCSPSCGHMQENSTHRKLASFRSVPAFPAEYEREYQAHAVTWSPIRKESLDIMEASVVYKDLRDSIQHLEVPGRNGCMLSSEGALRPPAVQDASELCEEEEKILELSSSDVRGRPLSLCMLKQRDTSKLEVRFPPSLNRQYVNGGICSPLSDSGVGYGRGSDLKGSVNSAFASLVFMMESLQQHTLRLRRVITSEADACLQGMMEKVHQEMQDTFLWLFQKVFACTPKLMLLTMMLLVDFAAHSMGDHVALAVMPMGEPPTCAIERSAITSSTSLDRRYEATDVSRMNDVDAYASSEPRFCEGGAGDGVVRVVKVGGGMDNDAASYVSADRAAMTAQDESYGGLIDASDTGYTAILGEHNFLKSDTGLNNSEEQRMLKAMWQQAVSKELNPRSLTSSGHILVAPVQAPALEADNYACYDRTDLKYQHELSRDPRNPLLLANYAQFLHVVRHDHDRADKLYKRAVKADPVDGELIGKYASFLWVAKEDREAADEAYKAALAVDPSNVYHTGSYAHFLWNSGADQDDISTPTTSDHGVSTSLTNLI